MRRSRLLENIFSMVTLRGMEYILSFLLIPYLLKTLGPTQYGSIAFMQGVIGYFILVVTYGFNMTAPRDIARASEEEWPTIFSTYFWAMCFLLIGSTLCFTIGYGFLHMVLNITLDIPLFLAVYISVVGLVIFPIWFFQGIQQMRYITLLNLVGRFITLILLFTMVKGPDDTVLAAFLQSCTMFFAGILSIILLYKTRKGLLKKPNKENLIKVYKEGWQIFLSTLAINFYTTSDIVILGALTNNTIVGYYSGADKLVNCIKRGIGAINDAVYPYISKKFTESTSEAVGFLKKQLYLYMICGFLGGCLILFSSPNFIPLLLGEKYIPSIEPLQIMAFVPMIVSMSNVLGYETMLPLGMEKIYTRILIMASIINLIIIVPLVLWKDASGVACSMFITETFVTIAMGTIIYKRSIYKAK